ncbi:MAG: lipopolysaccharide biosynthesis [Bryobacterales bacterium]|nr:lipopolysaccharide biosynthesis [Bryobacterales bacterium]
MKRLIRFAAFFYPVRWRKRYGVEFDALLEEVSPRWRDVFDVLGGAMKMQLTHGNSLKLVIGLAIAGALIASAFCVFALPDRYLATGVFGMPEAADRAESVRRVAGIQQKVLSRRSLAEVIQKQDLYSKERNTTPLEDVIEQMRRDLHMNLLRSNSFNVSFIYPDRFKAENTVNDLMARMKSEGALNILTPPALPQKPAAPNRLRIACFGLGLGFLTGVAVAIVMRMRTGRI